MDASLAILAGLVGLAVIAYFWWMDRRPRAAPPAPAVPAEPEDPIRRDKAITDLQKRLDSPKQKIDATAKDVEDDPRRAARAVREMMKRK
jgi:hypothetical protein